MARFEPTASQKCAIEETGRAVLVSAAAGSGKTRVLTERLLRRIEHDADIDSFLVITFTKAAAAELRSRILDEISERLAADPDNRRLKRQSALCAKAQIGTIDSFCQSFLRENCHAAQLSPEFKVIEEDRAEAIKQRVIQRVLDECYEAPDEGFKLLADTVGAGRSDDRLAETVLALHRKTQSHARPAKWLGEQLEAIEADADDAGKTVWGAEILEEISASAQYWAQRMDDVCQRAAENKVIAEKYGPSCADTALSLRSLSRACALGWDRARQELPVSFPTLGRLLNSPDPELSEYVKQVRALCKKDCEKFTKMLSDDSEKLLSDMRASAPAMRALIELTLRFDRAYGTEKRRRAEVDFADLEHLTAQLLTNEDGSPTNLACETGERFCEIMVDEYQDVNSVQDEIFRALSRDGSNLFMVGDVKQSIYRFRLADRKSDFYTALKAAAQDNEKCANFLKTLDKLRSRAPEMSIDELLMFVYDELDLMALCAAMQDAPQRCANMRMMLTLAKRFSAGGFRGLHRFCRWLRQLAERGGDMGAVSSGDAVKIMTIHKSKGLEFPVVFVCDTSRRFNDADLKQTVLVHPELGLGAKIYDTARRLEYPGLARSAIKQRLRREQLSEEMRLLYVALTRARERLFVTAAIKHPEEKMQKMMLQCTRPMSPEILLNASSMAEWMIYAQLCAGEEKFRLSFLSTEAQDAGQDTEASADIACADPELVAVLEKNTAFSYPHAAASALPSKVTATELKRLEAPDEEAQSIVPMQHAHFRAPRLGGGDKLSPTARGTATHMLLQYIDYEKTGTEQEIREELARLTAARFLSPRQAEAVDTGSILRLFSSPLGKRIMSADARKREFKFSLLCPAEKFFPGGEGESVLMQGVIDCMIEEAGELTIIDYKTDRVRGEETAERAQTYSKQLEAYAYAAQRMTGKPVRECVLYFLYSGETVKSSCK